MKLYDLESYGLSFYGSGTAYQGKDKRKYTHWYFEYDVKRNANIEQAKQDLKAFFGNKIEFGRSSSEYAPGLKNFVVLIKTPKTLKKERNRNDE